MAKQSLIVGQTAFIKSAFSGIRKASAEQYSVKVLPVQLDV